MHTRGEHANSTQKGPSRDSNEEPSHCEAMVLNTTPPCSPVTNTHSFLFFCFVLFFKVARLHSHRHTQDGNTTNWSHSISSCKGRSDCVTVMVSEQQLQMTLQHHCCSDNNRLLLHCWAASFIYDFFTLNKQCVWKCAYELGFVFSKWIYCHVWGLQPFTKLKLRWDFCLPQTCIHIYIWFLLFLIYLCNYAHMSLIMIGTI